MVTLVLPSLNSNWLATTPLRGCRAGDTARPYHYLRHTDDDWVLFGGADLPWEGTRTRRRLLNQQAGELIDTLGWLYPVLAGMIPEYAWEGLFATRRTAFPT